jgi:hypothetical protein
VVTDTDVASTTEADASTTFEGTTNDDSTDR